MAYQRLNILLERELKKINAFGILYENILHYLKIPDSVWIAIMAP